MTSEGVKLTKAQRTLLSDVKEKPIIVYFDYAPALRLTQTGLTEMRRQTFGTTLLTITEAGHVALADGTMATKPSRTQTR